MGRTEAPSGFGGRMTEKITEQVVRAKLSAAERLVPHTVRAAMGIQEEFFRLTGSEVKATVGPIWRMFADDPNSPEWLRKTGEFVGRGHGQWQTLLAGTATGAAMGAGVLSWITNQMAPVIGPSIAYNPNIWLAPAEAAAVSVRGIWDRRKMALEAAYSGIDDERFEMLRALNTTVLGPSEIVELYRRGEMDHAFALRMLTRVGFDGDHAKRLLTLSRIHVSLADAGQMWNRSIVTTAELEEIGRVNGYTKADAHRFAELGGEPPPLELLYSAFRRGFIDSDRLRRGVVQGPIRNEWFDVLQRMQYRSMTPEQAASAVTQGHMGIGRGRQIAQEYGLNDDDFSIIVETAGRPPGVEFAAEAWLRGFVTDAEYDAMFLESAIKNQYLPVLRKMRTRLVPQETARSLLAKGVASVEWTTDVLHKHGFSTEDTEKLIAAATVEKTTKTRDLSLSAVRELYAEQEITAEDATAMLVNLGYDEIEAAWELDLADLARIRTYRNAVISRVRAGFVKGLLTEADATTTLDGLQVPSARRDDLIVLWQIERETVTRDLTPAQIVAAAKKTLMTVATALSRLVGQGYDQGDASILLKVAGVVGA